ncbi:MAG TPA: hypothetical protein VFT72_05765 [Opitutaceae bacterium]|nr:hypothetical protein [Opitutaceae bacterium]
MFANFFQLISRRDPETYEDAFVHDVRVVKPRPRNPRIMRWLAVMWVFIGLKSLFVWWACARYPVPFSPMWIIGPTALFGILVTVVYCGRK